MIRNGKQTVSRKRMGQYILSIFKVIMESGIEVKRSDLLPAAAHIFKPTAEERVVYEYCNKETGKVVDRTVKWHWDAGLTMTYAKVLGLLLNETRGFWGVSAAGAKAYKKFQKDPEGFYAHIYNNYFHEDANWVRPKRRAAKKAAVAPVEGRCAVCRKEGTPEGRSADEKLVFNVHLSDKTTGKAIRDTKMCAHHIVAAAKGDVFKVEAF